MEKTNFTSLRLLQWLALPVFALILFSGRVSAQTIVCNDLVQVSVDPTPNGSCSVSLTADMILEGQIPAGNILLEVMNGINVLYSGINVVNFSGSNHLGQTLTVRATHVASGNKCWGQILVEDKAAPVCFGGEVEIPCTSDYNNVPFPDADDNCDLNPVVELANQTISTTNLCSPNGGYVLVTRTFIAIDDSGNQSNPCTQYIYVERPAYVDFPNDIDWECDQYASYPNITAAAALHPTIQALQNGIQTINATNVNTPSVLANTGSGIPGNIIGQYCNYQYTHAQQTLATCGNTFKIVRTWTVLDWCTNQVITSNPLGEDNVQIIKVADVTAPSITRAPFNVPANIPGQHPAPCKSQGYLQPATITDNCNDWVIRIFTPVGEATYLNGVDGTNGGFIPAPGLGLGSHQILYQAIDECNNIAELYVTVTVVDNIVPTTICDEITDVNLSSDGKAVVNASTFDDGSYDNCCLDEFVVRRMDGDCNGAFDDFGPTVTFCCGDVGTPIMVVFRAIDCFGNFNDCMVSVNVNDKLPPILLSCPQAQTITCDTYLQNYAAGVEQGNYSVLNGFGQPTFFDNCNYNLTSNVTVNLNNCTEGQIIRQWTASDANGQATCTQVINVTHVSNWVVEFPADVTVVCTAGQLPDTGEPEIFFDECELVGVAHDDQVFTVVPDACYKIVRTWNVINWCIYDDFGYNAYSEAGKAEVNLNVDWDGDGDKDNRTFRDGWNSTGSPGTPDGYITYKQTIKVMDNDAPDFTVPAIDGCIVSTGCTKTIALPYPTIDDDCSLSFIVKITGDFGTFNNVGAGGVNVPNIGVGEYEVTYSVTDNCGNTSYETITIEVEDCKKPTPLCDNGLVVEIMQTGMVEVCAEAFDEGSFDNCGPIAHFSYSSDITNTCQIFDCDDVLVPPTVQIWVTDIYGNQDFCSTVLIVQDNMGACGNITGPTIAGAISNEENEGVENVTVELSGNGMFSQITGLNGNYTFANVPNGGDYTVTPAYDANHGNGVTTYDLVLITRHILGIQPLNSPYKVIAADANRSNSVTTADMVEIRKVILQLLPEFPNNTSWRFVDKAFVFPNPAQPFASGFPEVISFNNLTANELFADFVAIKVGDVNGSAANNATGDVEDRNLEGAMGIQADDQEVKAGMTYTVDFKAGDLSVLGYQFTLQFDANALNLIDLLPGVAAEENFGLHLLDEGAITTSWNGESMDSDVLFSLVFEAKDNANLSDLLSISSRFTKAEAYNANGQLMDVNLLFNGQTKAGFELYQNVPNPFNGNTVIGFNLPETGDATLKVVDMSGKVLKVVQGEFAKGYNQVNLSASELPATGVLYYTLETDGFTATRKMVIVK